MWSKTVILSVLLSFYQVLGGEVPDVTTVYEIGRGRSKSEDNLLTDEARTLYRTPCINGVTGHVHARTNALGLGFVNDEKKYLKSNIPVELPNITCDVNFENIEGCTHWDFKNVEQDQWLLNSELSGITIVNGAAYKVKKSLILKKQKEQNKSFLIFTKGSGSLKKETIYIVVQMISSRFSVFYNCDSDTQSRSYSFHVKDRDGFRIVVYCSNRYRDFTVSSQQEYLTFYWNNLFEMYLDRGGRSNGEVTSFYASSNYDINYFSWITEDPRDLHSMTLFPRATNLNVDGEMISPIFTPQFNNLCLAIHFQSPATFSSSRLEISTMGLLPNDRDLLNIIDINKSGFNVKVVNLSLANMSPMKLSIKKIGQSTISILRVASCNPEGEEVVELPSPISVCPSDRRTHSWEAPKSSLHLHTTTTDILDPVIKNTSTNYCWNQGVLTTAGCACTPGFTGSKCEIGCDRNRFGRDCKGLCSFYQEECQGLLLCTKMTGCRCAPGYYGEDCTQSCLPGHYGNDCSERCGHCAGYSTCDIYTGECTSCEEGYLFPHCKIASVYYGSKPELTSPSCGLIVVSFDPNDYVTESEPPQLYQIQFREKGSQWKVYTTKFLQKSNDESEKPKKVIENIEGLKSGIHYQVRVLFIDAYFLKYDGDLVQIAEILTKCDIPSSYDYKLTATSNITAITFSWRYIAEDPNWCPLETFEATWNEGWKSKKIFTTHNYTLSNLKPGLLINFKIRAKTSGGFAPYSKTLRTSIQQNELPRVQNLRVESSQSTSVEVSWEPPRGSEDRQLRYIISYKCIDRPACSSGCQNVSEGQLTQEGTSITLSPLEPFTKYLVTVSAEGGVEGSIYVGTTKVVPTEVPSLSAQKPVRTNTSVTVFWDQTPVCTGYLLGYNYQLTKESDSFKILSSGFTKETNASFHNLTASTEYVVKVFVSTVAGWNPLSFLAINISTSATVPEAVRNLTVYKRGRGMLGLRWAEPQATYGQLKSFTVTHSLGQEDISHTVEPSHCVMWPDLYCHTIEGLRSNRRYNVTVSARNSEVAEDGELMSVSAVTKESPPAAPVNLKVTSCSSTSIELEWNHPEMANGILRSFLISVEETEKYDQDSCCQIYPFVETAVKEEKTTYNAEVSGLHPASTYFVSVSGKTVGLGPSQSLTAYTRPPHLPFTSLPRVQEPEVSWLPQEKLPEVNNSEVYSSLIRARLLLAVLNETSPPLDTAESGVTDPKLNLILQQRIVKPFYFIAEYNEDDDIEVSWPLEDSDSTWGQPPTALPPSVEYQLVAVQVLEYNGVFNVDLRYSQPFSMSI